MDTDVYIKVLDANTAAALQLAAALPENLLHHKTDGKWSLMEILEHVCTVDRVCMAIVSRPSDHRAEKKEMVGDERLKHVMVSRRDIKVDSPDILKPKGALKDIATFEEVFTGQREQLKQQLKEGTIIPDNRVNKHPFIGEMTYVDWLYFMLRHAERHLEQIKDIVKMRSEEKGS